MSKNQNFRILITAVLKIFTNYEVTDSLILDLEREVLCPVHCRQ